MPFTQQDLNLWQEQGDIDKFRQILTILNEDKYIDARLYSVKALGRMRDPHGLKHLLFALGDIEAVSESALEELKNWAAEDVNLFCVTAVDPSISEPLKRRIIKLIAAHPCERVVDTFITLLGKQMLVNDVQNAVREYHYFDLLKPKLISPSPELRYYAILALAKIINLPEVFSCLLIALDDEDPQVRCLAAELISSVTAEENRFTAIGVEQSQRVTELLMAHLTDDDFMVRSLSAEALAPIAVNRSAHGLILLLDDPYATVRKSAVYALSRVHNKRVYNRLVHLYHTENNIEVRSSIIHAIASTGHKESFGFLKTIIKSDAALELRIAALKVVIITPEIQPAIELLAEQLYIKEPYVIDTVIRIFYQSDINPPIEPLIRLVNEDIESLAERTVHIILNIFYKLRDRSTVEILLNLLDKELTEEITQHTIWLIIEIIKPIPVEDFLANLPSAQDGIYRIGVDKIKKYLEESDES